MQRETAIRRLTKRANNFLGMTLDAYLKTGTFKTEGFGGEYWMLNDNQSMQNCWFVLGCPISEDELNDTVNPLPSRFEKSSDRPIPRMVYSAYYDRQGRRVFN